LRADRWRVDYEFHEIVNINGEEQNSETLMTVSETHAPRMFDGSGAFTSGSLGIADETGRGTSLIFWSRCRDVTPETTYKQHASIIKFRRFERLEVSPTTAQTA